MQNEAKAVQPGADSGEYEAVRTFRFGCYEQVRFEMAAKHVHSVDDFGSHVVFGDGGGEVMRVIKPSARHGKGGVYFLNDKTGDGWGGPFNYTDYFLPEELQSSSKDAPNG